MKEYIVIETGENTALSGIIDAFAKSIIKKAEKYFGIKIKGARSSKVYTVQGKISNRETALILEKIFQKPTKSVILNGSLVKKFSTAIWYGLKPGVKDNEGEVAQGLIEEILGKKIEGVYVSQVLYLENKLKNDDLQKIIKLIANSNVDRWEIIPKKEWNFETGIGPKTSEVKIQHKPQFKFLNLNISSEEFNALNNKNNWALGTNDFIFLKKYFYENNDFREIRQKLGLKDITDVEIECMAQTLSDHCSHRTFGGIYQYRDSPTGEPRVIDNLFKTYIKIPTEMIAKMSPWIVSVLKDNAGAMFLDAKGENVVGIKIETHNSPSWKDPYGGSITATVGVKRDPLGFGRWGLKLAVDICRFSVASRDYAGELIAEIHPLQIHDGIIAGIRDGGNKHGVPTIRHRTIFDDSYLGKGHVFGGTIGISPRIMAGKLIEDKEANPGDLVVIFGGRTGIDGIHGVTEASMGFSDKITMGHVQKGNPYCQRKVSELMQDAALLGLFNLVWDLGGGGLSSLITEVARFSNGIEVDLAKVLLKYQGLDWWQILVSESQERMHGAISPENIEKFMELAALHDVEVSVIGKYTASGAVHILADGQTCAWLPIKLLHDEPPQWRINATWIPPELRLCEPAISEPTDYNELIKTILGHENVCSKEWVMRQFDFRVKGQTVIPPLIGKNENIESPASVIRPILEKEEAVSVSDAANPRQSIIDPYHMTVNVYDIAIRSVAAVSGIHFKNGKPVRLGILDNYCWPEILKGLKNPDAEYKAAQLIRSLEAFKDVQEKCQIPALSGKDSMYIKGDVKGGFGEKHTISGLPLLAGTAIASVDEAKKCLMPKFECDSDLIAIIGPTKNELGASVYYQILGYVGLNIPKTDIVESMKNVEAVSEAINAEILSSAYPIAENGLIIALSKMAIAGDLGAKIDLRKMPLGNVNRNSQAMLSETGGRFIITFNIRHQQEIERIMQESGRVCKVIGIVTDEKILSVIDLEGKEIFSESVENLENAYTKRFGDLV